MPLFKGRKPINTKHQYQRTHVQRQRQTPTYRETDRQTHRVRTQHYFSNKESFMILASSSSSRRCWFICSSCSLWDSSSANVSWSFSDIWCQGRKSCDCFFTSLCSHDSDDGNEDEEGNPFNWPLSLRLSSSTLQQKQHKTIEAQQMKAMCKCRVYKKRGNSGSKRTDHCISRSSSDAMRE